MAVVGAVAKAADQDIDNITLSEISIRRHPRKNSKGSGHSRGDRLPEECLIQLHWDAKKLPDIGEGRERVERLVIHITGGGKENLLEAANIPQATKRHIAEAVIRAVSEAGLEARVQGIVFDTTASNTGIKEGSCIKIQESLGRNLLWFACRHHILEVVIAGVFKYFYGPSGPFGFGISWTPWNRSLGCPPWKNKFHSSSYWRAVWCKGGSLERAQAYHRTRELSKGRLHAKSWCFSPISS